MFRNLFVAATILAISGQAVAQVPPKKTDNKTLVTKVYDLRLVLGERGKANGYADMDAVIKMLLENFTDAFPGGELKPGSDGPQLIERDGGKLEVRVNAESQKEIGDVVEALHRLVDIAIDVNAEVIELDPAAMEKLLKALPAHARGKAGSPLFYNSASDLEEKEPSAEEKKTFAEASKILNAGKVVQTSTARFVNGSESVFSARQAVQAYHNHVVNKKPVDPPQFAKEGFKLIGLPLVSADRRFIRLKLTEQSLVVTGIKKRELNVIQDQKLVLSSLETEDLGSTGSTTIPDGGLTVFRLAYAPKDKVWVVVLRPTLFIQAEEDFRKKEEKK